MRLSWAVLAIGLFFVCLEPTYNMIATMEYRDKEGVVLEEVTFRNPARAYAYAIDMLYYFGENWVVTCDLADNGIWTATWYSGEVKFDGSYENVPVEVVGMSGYGWS